jgi:tetratricopeptide (TPR) repeat protein
MVAKRPDLPASMVLACGLAVAACGTPAPVHSVNGLTALKTFGDSVAGVPRPRLAAGLDTNDAAVYYQAAIPLVRSGTRLPSAEAALYWASRLDPTWADPLYARALILLRAWRNDAMATFWKTSSARAAKRVTMSPRQGQLMDSLRRIAWARNPFLYTGLDVADFVPRRDAPPEDAGLYAYKQQRLRDADSLFGIALRKHPGDVGLRVYRAHALFYLKRYDDAVAELEAGRDSLRAMVREHTAFILPSAEMFDYAIGVARVQQDDFPSARAAFQRALTENLAAYWVHARLAGASLALADTNAALLELQIAIDLEGRDPALRLYYGVVLYAAGRFPEAEQQLRTAIELDPDYAAPYHWLGAAYQAQGRAAEAVVQYRAFLAHTAQHDTDRAAVTQALAVLGAVSPDSR